MFLSEIPIDECMEKVVWNHNKTKIGKVIDVLPEDRFDYSVIIEWEGLPGEELTSLVWHSWCDKLEVID